MATPVSIEEFLKPLFVDIDKINRLSQLFLETFEKLAAGSENQGGTNLRVGFVQLGNEAASSDQANGHITNGSDASSATRHVRRLLEKSWPIDEHLKNENPDSLFLWIGKCIAEVVQDGCDTLHLQSDQTLPLGVTFSFPMVQHSLSQATLMQMGKGFAISPDQDLGDRLTDGYNRAKSHELPPIRVEAIANDSVSTLVSFIFNFDEALNRRAAMGLILGTGCNATIPLKLSQLNPSKRPKSVVARPEERVEDVKIAINTEWSINGTAPPLHEVGLVSQWDKTLDIQGELNGFQPLEFMTAGRYLGELGRIMLVDYLTEHLGIAAGTLPQSLLQQHNLTTTFLSHFKPLRPSALVAMLQQEFPESTGSPPFEWTEDLATAVYRIAKAIEVRAAGIVAAATLALLTLAEEVPGEGSEALDRDYELGVGYTGGCIVHFQDYLQDCQNFLDQLLRKRFGEESPLRAVLSPFCRILLFYCNLSLSSFSSSPVSNKTSCRSYQPAVMSPVSDPGRAAPAPAPVPVPVRTNSRSSDSDGSVVDPAEFENLSRSLTTGAHFLQPESLESAMLRPSSYKASHYLHDEEQEGVISEAEGEDDSEISEDLDNVRPHEGTPLISHSRRHSITARSTTSAVTEIDTPFLNNTSPTRFWFIFSQILTAYFISCFDGTIMASSHPVITSYFNASNSASWLSTAFLLTSSAFQPLLGRLSDALGRKPLFVGALGIFAAATTWCALANSIESFILGRAFCGIGAGGVMTIGSIIVSDLVPIENRGVYQSYINMNYGVGSSLGAAAGGAMADYLGWRWEFGVQIPPLLICMVVAWIAIPDDLGIQGERKGVWQALKEFDIRGSLLLTTAITFVILGLNLGGNVLPWSHPFVIASLVIFAITFPVFLWVESWVHKPIMPLHLLNRQPRGNLIFSNVIAAMVANSILFNIPLYFQAVLLTSATSSGLRLIIPTIAASSTGTFVGFAVTWTGRLKWPVLSGTICILIGTIGLVFLQRDLPSWVYLFILLPSSIGQGFQFPGTFMAILAASPQAEQAVVTSTLMLWRSLGQVLGVASSSLVVQNALLHYLKQYVTGEGRDEIIRRVRESVEEVAKLEPKYREQVIVSYEAALRLTFITCAVFAFTSVVMIWPIKLPRLGVRKHK
ncbi:major facilitator superfamily-domain-containing protein [Fusarium oxysporum Fo47]|nr:major facilitator superfamily-domain-containing protein [Fusarium oxysporum Fo47]WJG35155.1 major facilitator superfamily-domain-containing protein [Fusarium oxysporum Fo47]